MGGVNLTIPLGQLAFSVIVLNSVSTSFETPMLTSRSIRDLSVGHFFAEVTFPKTMFYENYCFMREILVKSNGSLTVLMINGDRKNTKDSIVLVIQN